MAVAVSGGITEGVPLTTIVRLEVNVVDDASVLLRIVSLCHQRGCRIASLRYERNAGSVILGVDASSPQAMRLEIWLSKLIHVLAVRVVNYAGEASATAV